MAPTIERHIPVFPDHEHLWRRKSKGVDLMLEDAASQASVLHGAFERAWTQLCAAAGVDRPHADWQAPLETVRPGGSVRCTRTGQTLDTRGNARVSPARGPVSAPADRSDVLARGRRSTRAGTRACRRHAGQCAPTGRQSCLRNTLPGA